MEKQELGLTIEGGIVTLILPNKTSFVFELEYLIFGSKTSLDCDMMMRVPKEFTELHLNTHTYNKMCEILDKILGAIIGTEKVINSSLGNWENGQIIWAQKGSDVAEVNNSIKATFANHMNLQMFEVCPLTVAMKRDVWEKIMTTIRDILCKMNKSCFLNDDSTMTLNLVLGILDIPEIRDLPKNKLTPFVHALLRGYFINKNLHSDLIQVIPELTLSCNTIVVSAENKRNKLKPLNQIIDNIIDKKPAVELVRGVILSNVLDQKHVLQIIDALKLCKNKDLLAKFIDETDPGLIRLNRLIRQVRRIQELGTRSDMLMLLNWSNIVYLMDDVDIKDRFKDIAFKTGQCLALMDGLELYDKADIAAKYPNLAVFLWRGNPTQKDLTLLTEFVHAFVNRVRLFPGFERSKCENLRHN